MSTRSRRRLLVLHVLVLSLMLALLGRLWFLQVLTGERFDQAAAETRTREVLLPALRGEIYDAQGRALVSNRSQLVVSVDRGELQRQPDGGKAVLKRLARVLPSRSYKRLSKQIRLCSSGVDKPCWNGSPYQPVPVAENVKPQVALQILERKAQFPGVVARAEARRSYPSPNGAQAAHMVGHLAPISEKEYKRREGTAERLTRSALVGADGLEATYEQSLRGTPGVRRVSVNSSGRVIGTASKTPPKPGSHLVTSINTKVQQDVEQALKHALQRARDNGKPAEAAAGVVLDVRTGRVIAMSSMPNYDPAVWVGGIKQQQYDRLSSEKANQPLVDRAMQGKYPVGSTFKPITLAAAVKAGFPLDSTYPCPGSYQVGNRSFTNYDSIRYGPIKLHRSIVISCDTVFYRFAHLLWQRQGGTDQSGSDSTEPIPHMAKSFGLGSRTGIDMPGEASGRIPDPKWKRQYWKGAKDTYCKRAKEGYPDVAKENPKRARYLKEIAVDFCKRGYVWRAGDAVNLSIGQGDMLATPLQLARAYAAIANGGTLYSPRVGKAIVRPDGSVVKKIQPSKKGKVPVSDKVLQYIQDALADVPRRGTAAGTFADFPLKRIPVAGKTGTAQARGEEDTAWFASYAPANNPRYAVVAMVSQGGLGSQAAAPAVEEIYKGIYGVGKEKPAVQGGSPATELPRVTDTGALKPPKAAAAASSAEPAAAGPQPAGTTILGMAAARPAAVVSRSAQRVYRRRAPARRERRRR